MGAEGEALMGIINKLYTWAAGQVVSPSELTTEFNQVINLLNGNIEGVNIQSGTITDDLLSDKVSPLVRWRLLQDFVAEGLAVSAVGLDCAVLGGVALVSGAYLSVAGTSHTVVDNTTTYCDLSSSGTFSWNSNAVPASGHLRLAKIVSAGGTCTVTDMRTLAPVGARQIEADAIWDIASANATDQTDTVSKTRATLLSSSLSDAKAGDTIFLFGMAQLSASAACAANLGFQVGGADTAMEPEEDIETADKDKILTVGDIYAVVADAESLAVNLTWRTSTGTLAARHRTLIAVRWRPTGS